MPNLTVTNDPVTLFGRRVRQLRKERWLTQEQLGDRVGLHRTHISHIERGRNPAITTALKVAKALELDLADLMKGIRLP